MSFIELLIKKGYKPFRYDGKSNFNIPEDMEKINDFSSARPGGLCVAWIHPNKPDFKILWGLHEAHKPPTLITPRPKIEVLRKKTIIFKGKEIETIVNEKSEHDHSMNLVLQKETPEKIYEAIFDKTIIFKYDLR